MKKTKHIDIVVKYFLPVTAGIETNILNTYSILSKNGWVVTIHTSNDTHTEKNILKSYEKIQGLKVKRYPFSWYGFFPNIDYKNINLVAIHNFDIFPHLHILIKCLFLKLLGQKNFGLVLTPHGGFTPEWSMFSKLQTLIKKTYHYSLGTFLINSVVDYTRAVSNWEYAQITSHGVNIDKVLVISNGIETQAFENIDKKASKEIKSQVKKYGRYLVQIGRIYPIKNYETTIKALSKLPKDINFVIAGSAEYVLGKSNYKNDLDKLIKKLGLEKRVIFAGVIRGYDKYYLIKHSQMMVHMALWESFCNVVHEAMSQGKVCIVAKNTALPYLVKEGINGFCIPTKNAEKLAEKINYVLKNKNSKNIKTIKLNNKKFAKSHSWKTVAEKMDKLYTDLTNSKKVNFQKALI